MLRRKCKFSRRGTADKTCTAFTTCMYMSVCPSQIDEYAVVCNAHAMEVWGCGAVSLCRMAARPDRTSGGAKEWTFCAFAVSKDELGTPRIPMNYLLYFSFHLTRHSRFRFDSYYMYTHPFACAYPSIFISNSASFFDRSIRFDSIVKRGCCW